ncbi:FecR domain-containing protein [Blastopirellula sp. J2-11]|uniref:LamG-like jellyroll fold domain-containing protein n=1 Tax=Blastopirellula sp. J2-11 TaxID=2943192 RepID=UPI0021C5B171|nr:LamG-like jellyroll fold domain-containing protein [Blastopirellula sp. J2-11]UUO07848.1 FecR domain-containing protein [Blastopirellula sp. J2-11]
MENRDELISKYLFGLATEEDFQQLKTWLEQSSGNVQSFAQAIYLHRTMRDQFLGEEYLRSAAIKANPPTPEILVAQPGPSVDIPSPLRSHWSAAWLSLALALMVGMGSAAWMLGIMSDHEVVGVARVLEQHDATFDSTSLTPQHSDTLVAGTYSLTQGEMLVRFDQGAVAVMRGPTKFQLKSPSAMKLLQGEVVVTCPTRQSRGFRVSIPNGDVVDLGTEFGVAVNQAGEADVYVFQGEVTAESSGKSISLFAGKSARVSQSRGAYLARVEPGRFYRQRDWEMQSLLGRSQRDPGMVKDADLLVWLPMDRLHGQTTPVNLAPYHRPPVVVRAAEIEDVSDSGARELTVAKSTDSLSMSIPGAFRQLTLAAWVRLGKEQGPDREHRGMVMSDSFQKRGAIHWQRKGNDFRLTIAMGKNDNHEIFRAPTGRLDVDRWHHLASVVDLDAKRVTHYLNGAEVASQPITTALKSVLLGDCTLGAWARGSEPESDNRSLNGDLDDVCIWKRALDGDQIHSLAARRSD